LYNEEERILNCLSSVTKQCIKDIEILVVDDVSIDNSVNIVSELASKDKRVKLICHAQNLGQGEARNTGIRQSSGQYIFFLDSDDFIPRDGLKTLYEIATKYDSDIVIGKTISEVEVDGNYIRGAKYNVDLETYHDLIYNHSVWNKLFKRSFLSQNRIFFEPPKYGEDILFSLRTNMMANSISITTKSTYNYTWLGQVENVSKNKVTNARDNIIKTLLLVEENCSQSLIHDMRCKVARNAFSVMPRVTSVYDRSQIREYLKPWHEILSLMPDSVFSNIPETHSKFCQSVIHEKYLEAYDFALQHKRHKSAQSGFEFLFTKKLLRVTSVLRNSLRF
jgi:glycosyltransferase involved in cell wall biosynthesis